MNQRRTRRLMDMTGRTTSECLKPRIDFTSKAVRIQVMAEAVRPPAAANPTGGTSRYSDSRATVSVDMQISASSDNGIPGETLDLTVVEGLRQLGIDFEIEQQ
jgi:hypothetical protein